MNNQEAFTKMVEGIIDQGGPGFDDYCGRCKFITKEGKKCAIGQLMTDDEARKIQDSFSKASKASIFIDKVIKSLPVDYELANSVRRAHDNSAQYFYRNKDMFMSYFLNKCLEISKEFNLKMPQKAEDWLQNPGQRNTTNMIHSQMMSTMLIY